MSETSQYFVAELGDATPEVETRLIQWAEGSCVAHRFARGEYYRAAIYFARGEGRTVRQMQSLLRTLTARWGVPLGQLDAGWLRALTLDEFRARVPAPKLAAPAMTGRSEAAEPSLDSGGLAQPCAVAYAAQPLAEQGKILERLPKGFDQRSREAFRAAARVQTAS